MLYNAASAQYVLWFNWIEGANFANSYYAVATSKSLLGPYELIVKQVCALECIPTVCQVCGLCCIGHVCMYAYLYLCSMHAARMFVYDCVLRFAPHVLSSHR